MIEQVRTYKYRIYPSRKQTARLFNQLDIACAMYNKLLETCDEAYKKQGISLISKKKLCEVIKNMKQEDPAYSLVYSQALQNCADRLVKAYQNAFRRLKQKQQGGHVKVGFPRFKKKFRSLIYPQFGFKFKSDRRLHVSKVGELPIKLHRLPKGKLKTLTIKHNQAGQWHAIFTCVIQKDIPEQITPRRKVGIDLGIENLATLSNGEVISNPKYLVRSECRLRRRQQQLSRKDKGSNNWRKGCRRLARLYNKIANQRRDFLHKVSRGIADRYQQIFMENLDTKNMVKNHRLAKHINDASWGILQHMLAYKAESAGGELVLVDPRGTSALCSGCGEEVPKQLSERVHDCPHCGLVLSRDLNAAINILRKGTAGLAGTHTPAETMVATGASEAPASQVAEAGTTCGLS